MPSREQTFVAVLVKRVEFTASMAGRIIGWKLAE